MTRLMDVLWLALFLAVCVLIVLAHRAWRDWWDHDQAALEHLHTPPDHIEYPISHVLERKPR